MWDQEKRDGTSFCVSGWQLSVRCTAIDLQYVINRSCIRQATRSALAIGLLVLCHLFLATASLSAGEEHARVRDGIKLYQEEKYAEAGKEFAVASETLDKLKSEQAAVAAFDEACAYHRNGEQEKARDRYLKAGLSQDRGIATASHFNLGTMLAEHARKLAGETPEAVPAEKRQEILDELKQAIASYRHCLELQSDHVQSRRNLELVRNWIKYYTDRWRELDRQKLRDESNLIAFLEFLMQTETAILQTVEQLPENVATNAFAEIKRAQDDLREEVPTLREKIETELQPAVPQPGATPQPVSQEVQDGIKLLQGWADEADNKMASASRQLAKANAKEAASDQQAAVDELDRIWDAVIPFQPLLAKELSDQTTIARTLLPEEKSEPPADDVAAEIDDSIEIKPEAPDETADQVAPLTNQTLSVATQDFKQLAEAQEKTLRKARLLSPKAEAKLSRIESQPPADDATVPATTASDPNSQDASPSQPTVDPEAVKAGLRKAIELGPQAVAEMESAVKQLQKKDGDAAAKHAEEARRILEEIQQAQPKNEQQDQQNKDENQEQEKNKDQENKDPQEDEQKKDGDKQEQSNEKKPDQEKPGGKEDGKEQPGPQEVSQDRIEEALRKVRERQQEKRERDQEARMRIIGPAPVDKDW